MKWYELDGDTYLPPPGPWTDQELDRRHEMMISRFPGGLTYESYCYLTLESARDCDELCHPPGITGAGGFGHFHGVTWRMWKEGLIEHGGGYNAPMRWYITSEGQAELARLRPKYDPIWYALPRGGDQ